MMLTVLVYASDRCGNNIKPASSRKVFGRFRKVLKAKKFLDLARHRLDTYSGSRIHRRLRGVWLTLDYICYLFCKTWYNVFEPLLHQMTTTFCAISKGPKVSSLMLA